MVYCAVKAGREDEMIKWGSGSDRWGRERLLGTTLEGEAELWKEESRAAFELVERMYQEQIFRLNVSEHSQVLTETASETVRSINYTTSRRNTTDLIEAE